MPAKDNIVLIGMPGVGKSTLGVVLAKIGAYDFLDCDLLIQSEFNNTLQNLIDNYGPLNFLALENQVLCEIDVSHTIISTGGSAVYSAPAMEHLASIGTVVYLRTSFQEIQQRVGSLEARGVVSSNGEQLNLRALYDERCPLYEHYANVVVDVEGLSVREATAKAVELIQPAIPQP